MDPCLNVTSLLVEGVLVVRRRVADVAMCRNELGAFLLFGFNPQILTSLPLHALFVKLLHLLVPFFLCLAQLFFFYQHAEELPLGLFAQGLEQKFAFG